MPAHLRLGRDRAAAYCGIPQGTSNSLYPGCHWLSLPAGRMLIPLLDKGGAVSRRIDRRGLSPTPPTSNTPSTEEGSYGGRDYSGEATSIGALSAKFPQSTRMVTCLMSPFGYDSVMVSFSARVSALATDISASNSTGAFSI
jgi:hypothetical protein